jgi:signal transduction histidine kinase/CheY-like chemotaxis protein
MLLRTAIGSRLVVSSARRERLAEVRVVQYARSTLKTISEPPGVSLLFARCNVSLMRFREVVGHFRDGCCANDTNDGGAQYLRVSSRRETARSLRSRFEGAVLPHLASPSEQVFLELPALRARRLLRIQVAAIVVSSIVVTLLGMFFVSLSEADRSPWLLAIAVAALGGAALVGLADFLHGRCLRALLREASALRLSAAERAAELARMNAELRRRDVERDSILPAMAHELRTPLGSIVGFSRALLDGIDGPLGDEQRLDVLQIQQGAQRLLGFVDRTLDIARLQAGQLEIALEPVQLAELLHEVVGTLRPLAAERGLTLDFSPTSSLPAVQADEEYLRQVLANLIGNAVKFTLVGSVKIGVTCFGSQAAIAVSDTGIGIAFDQHERIFEPFQQAETILSRGRGGTGLGLALCRRLVQQMGGSIRVESELGAGSTFVVSLPLAELRALPLSAPGSITHACDVMVIGEPTRIGSLMASLRSQGLDVRVTSDVTIEQDLFVAEPRLVLVDLLMGQQATWTCLTRLSTSLDHTERLVGLVGLANGGGRIAIPGGLDLVTDSNLESILASRIRSLHLELDRGWPRSRPSALVVGHDLSWRRPLGPLLEASGMCSVECRNTGEALAVARDLAVRLIVVDLLLPGPGVLELLDSLQSDPALARVPVCLVGPAWLTPSQQLNLRHNVLRWSREDPVAVSDLVSSVARLVACPTREATHA